MTDWEKNTVAIPDSMIGVAITEPGGPDVLKPQELPVPRPMGRDVLIAVEAAGVNRPDVLQRMGAYPAPKGHSPLPGLEVAGTVAAVGPDCQRWQVGDRVCALLNGGGYAAFAIADERQALPIPAGLSAIEAAGLPETVFTVHHNVFERGRLRAGAKFLVHGGSSGIGTTAIQMAKAAGAFVVTTVGSPEKAEAVTALGADVVVNHREEDFVSIMKAHGGADVILDMVGGDYIARNLKACAPDAHIVQIAFLQGSKVEIDLMSLMLKRITLTGSTLRARTEDVKARIAGDVEARVWPLVRAPAAWTPGRLKPLIHSTFALNDAAAAHALMETNAHIGKIVLTV